MGEAPEVYLLEWAGFEYSNDSGNILTSLKIKTSYH